ncbi:MAG: hypothetical protein EZS28_002976 [Streblomastix strix]|uniref:Uncharacterized protein n=1 Tax=Streblomastix strix TaxID=222440 RepID=A0A5J4X3D5_9EUKA|nr:MAG: hypothetical protein EZS28_002976 [Streblomastix strix]
MYEVYYAKKAENLDLTGERATKHVKELILQRDDETLGLEFKKNGVTPGSGGADPEDEIETARMAVLIQRACVAGSTALNQGDFQATQRRFLTVKRNSSCFGAIQSSAGQIQQHFRCTWARIQVKIHQFEIVKHSVHLIMFAFQTLEEEKPMNLAYHQSYPKFEHQFPEEHNVQWSCGQQNAQRVGSQSIQPRQTRVENFAASRKVNDIDSEDDTKDAE